MVCCRNDRDRLAHEVNLEAVHTTITPPPPPHHTAPHRTTITPPPPPPPPPHYYTTHAHAHMFSILTISERSRNAWLKTRATATTTTSLWPSPGPLTPDANICAQVSKDRFSTEEIRRAYDLTPSMYRPRYNLLTICIYDVNAFFPGHRKYSLARAITHVSKEKEKIFL